MRRLRLVAIFLLVALAGCQSASTDFDLLQGRWQRVWDQTEDLWVFEGDVLTANGKRWKVTLHPDTDPRQMDMERIPDSDIGSKAVVKAIYKIDGGNKLTVYW